MSSAACINPIGPPDSTSRSVFKPDISTLTPWLTSPSTFACGISQFSNTNSQVLEPRMPSLSSFCAVEKPFMPRSIRKAVMQRLPASLPAVRMYTISTSASGPLVIHILLPLATQTSPCNCARQVIEPTTSDPAPGSLIASAPFHSPEHSLGRYRARCAALPLLYRFCTHRLECAP